MTVIKLRARPDWLKQCILSDGRKPVPLANLANAIIGLEHDPALAGILAYDEFACEPVLCHGIGDMAENVRELTDDDVAQLQEFLQHAGLKNLGKDTAYQAIEHVARLTTFHPVLDYLDSLTWDGTPRIKTWLPVYAGTAMTDYELTIGPLFLISMIARVRNPGCKADHMLVLEGEQGKLKSTLFDNLASPWFSDDLPPDIGSKDAKIHLRGKWLIEVAEMHAFTKAEATQLKSFLSRREERYRPPYGRLEVHQPRQCVFAGTTNRDTYLRDETGNRRFWPTRAIERIQPDAMQRDRFQLLAEADHQYKAGTQWWPNAAFEREHIKPQQDERYETDEWQERVAEYLYGAYLQKTHITCTVVAVNALGYGDKIDRLGKREQLRISAILETLGWKRGKRGTGGVKLWEPPESWSLLPTNEIKDLLGLVTK